MKRKTLQSFFKTENEDLMMILRKPSMKGIKRKTSAKKSFLESDEEEKVKEFQYVMSSSSNSEDGEVEELASPLKAQV